VTAFPAIGNFHAVAPFALALRRAGHEVCVATAPDLVPWSITCGLPTRAVGPMVRTLVRSAEAESNDPPADRMLTDVWPHAVIADLLRLGAEWRPDLIVHEEGEYAALLVGASLGVPCITHSWASPALPPPARAEAVTRLTPLWAQHAPDATPTTTGQVYLDACPPPFQLVGLRDVPHVIRVRGVPFDGPAHPAPGWLSDLPRPAVYVTLGADPAYSEPELLNLLARSSSVIASSVVVTTGPRDPASLGTLPPNVRALAYLPQSQVLPHVDVVVSHGGAGGMLGALMHALPHLVVPGRNQSQQDVAAVTAGIGIGLRLRSDQHDEAAIRAALVELISDVRFELAASKVRAQLETLPGPDEAVDLSLAAISALA
jgi:UDP:flavonoid glycosyltransferase YjiC (YdhE family)